jgi:hypothetical protein
VKQATLLFGIAKLYLEKKPNQIHFKFFKEAISDLITGIPLWFQESDLSCKNLEGFLSQLASSELLFAGINFNLKEKPHELADLLSQVHNNTTELLNNYNHGVRPLIKQFQEDLSNFKEAVSKFNVGFLNIF